MPLTTTQVKSSSHLILLTIVLIVMTIAMAMLAHSSNHFLKNDAYLINSSGLIRGSIQRLIKLHASHQQEELQHNIVLFIDNRLATIKQLHEKQYASSSTPQITLKMNELSATWQAIKLSLDQPAKNQDVASHAHLLILSETAWHTADEIAHLMQLAAEEKTAYFKYFYWVAGFILIINVISLAITYYSIRVKIERMATLDNLTQIANRYSFMQYFQAEYSRALRYRNPCSLIMIDIDHFKLINDTHGHLVGDSTLQMVCNVIQTNLRSNDLLGRIGGEEFAILATQTDLEGAISLAEKIRAAIEANFFDIGDTITISAGIATLESGMSLAQWMDAADKALYKAKHQGRNIVMPKPK